MDETALLTTVPKAEPKGTGGAKPEPKSEPRVKTEPTEAAAEIATPSPQKPPRKWQGPDAAQCYSVCRALAEVHGMPQRAQVKGGCGSARSVLDSLVQTILSQNTTDLTSARAFQALKKAFPTWKVCVRSGR